MQTSQLTTTQAGAFLPPIPDGISSLGPGHGGIDFAAFLLSLLSMESLPLEVEVDEPEKPILASENQVAGETAKSPSLLLMTLLSNAETITPLSANPEPQTHHPAESLNLTANNRPQPATPILNEHVGVKVLADDFRTAIFAGETISNNNDAAALFTSHEYNAKATSVSSSPVKQAKQNIPENLTRPVPFGSQDVGLNLSDYGIELPDWPGGSPNGLENIAAISISGDAGQTENSLLMPQKGTQSTTVIAGQETDVRSNGFVPAPVKAGTLLVPATQVSGSLGNQTGITAENITTTFPEVEVESLKVPVNSSAPVKPDQAYAGRASSNSISAPTASRFAGAIGAEMAESLENSTITLSKNSSGISGATMTAQVSAKEAKISSNQEQSLPQPAILSGKETPGTQQKSDAPIEQNPAGKPPATKFNPIPAAETKASSRSVSTHDRVSVSGSNETRANLSTSDAAPERGITSGQHATDKKQTSSVSTGPNLPGGIKVKSEAVRVNGEVDGKPIPSTGHLEPNVTVKGKADLPESPRVQFTVEPESFRRLMKPPAEIRLRLHPDQLGMVKLQLRTVDHHLTARVVVQSTAARLAVEGNLTELQRTMSEAGLVIDRFEVTVGHTTSASTLYPDSDGQRRRYAYKPKANRRYQAVAQVQQTESAHPQPAHVIAAAGGQYRLNMVA